LSTPSKDTGFSGKKGTKVFIEKSTFNESEDITIVLKEPFEMDEIILNNLSTVSNNKLLETDGMIFISALNSKGDTLSVNSNKEITITLPSVNNVYKTNFFLGSRNKKNKINWQKPSKTNKYLINIPFNKLDFYPQSFKANQKYCGLNRKNIDLLKSKKFNKTFIATKEFEERIKYLHLTCDDKTLKIYLDNINENLWVSDSLVYQYLVNKKSKYSTVFFKYQS